MLQLFNSTLAMTIALAYLLSFLFAPFLLAWFMWDIARSLRRIAHCVDFEREYPATAGSLKAEREQKPQAQREPRAQNTVLGQ